jgi:hypothetical protein
MKRAEEGKIAAHSARKPCLFGSHRIEGVIPTLATLQDSRCLGKGQGGGTFTGKEEKTCFGRSGR